MNDDRVEAVDTAVSTPDPGAILRTTREAKNYSLPKVAKELGLTESSLRNLEKNCFDRFPAGIYVRGYLRNYCKLLEIDDAEVLALYYQVGGEQSPECLVANQISKRDASTRSSRIAIAVVVVAALLALFIWLLVRSLGS